MQRLALLSIGMALAAIQAVGAAPAIVEVQATDGRVLRGALDARTNEVRLWVRKDEGQIVLVASVAWSDVAKASLDGKDVDAAALQRSRSDLASEGQFLFDAGAPTPPDVQQIASWSVRQDRRRVRSLEIVDACLVNLDRDVEPDGLMVSIAAIDDRGQPVVVRGSLTARLFGERRPASVAAVEFGELDAWSQPVSAADFVDGAATYELRFRRTAPEWQFDLLPDAVLEVRLGAFGDGNYAASAPVLIRAFNPLRDNRQLLDETRFLPRELHGRNPASSITPRNGLWLHWTR